MDLKYKFLQEYIQPEELRILRLLIEEDINNNCFDEGFRNSTLSSSQILELLKQRLMPIMIYYSNNPIGIIGYKKLKESEYEIGIVILQKYQHQGIGKKAVLNILKLLFEQRKAQRVIASIKLGNISSLNLFTRLGFEGINRFSSDKRYELGINRTQYNRSYK